MAELDWGCKGPVSLRTVSGLLIKTDSGVLLLIGSEMNKLKLAISEKGLEVQNIGHRLRKQ